MNSIAKMNPDSLGQMLGRAISDAVVLIAKNIVLGSDPDSCAQILGVEVSEIHEIQATQDYKDVYLILAAHYNQANVQTDLNYDDIEQRALGRLDSLIDRADIDQSVRVATMANRAQRRQVVSRNLNDTLDPTRVSPQVNLTLSRRIVEKLQGGAVRDETQQISIHGIQTSPSFQQVSDFLNGKPERHPDNYRPESDGDVAEVSLEALLSRIKGQT